MESKGPIRKFFLAICTAMGISKLWNSVSSSEGIFFLPKSQLWGSLGSFESLVAITNPGLHCWQIKSPCNVLVGLCNCLVVAVFGISRRENPRSQMENFLRFLLDLNSLLSFDVKSSRAFTLDLTPCVEQDHLNFQPKHLVFWDNKIFLSLSPSAPD